MRPPKEQRSRLRYPLDAALGSEANVRLLRVLLHDVGGPLGVSDAARMAGLSTTGARKALEALANLGIVNRVGTGGAQKYGPSGDASLTASLSQLFRQEQQQYDELRTSLRDAVAIPEVLDAWLRETPSSDRRSLELDVVAETKAFGWIGPELRTRLSRTEKHFNIIVEVNSFTRADDPQMPDDATLLWGPGWTPVSPPESGAQSHSDSAERSWRMARAIAEMIKSDPSLPRRALQHTNLLLHEGQGTANSDIGEWRQLLETYSNDRLRDLLVSRSSRADRLRRSSPFFAILTPDERDRLMSAMDER